MEEEAVIFTTRYVVFNGPCLVTAHLCYTLHDQWLGPFYCLVSVNGEEKEDKNRKTPPPEKQLCQFHFLIQNKVLNKCSLFTRCISSRQDEGE